MFPSFGFSQLNSSPPPGIMNH